MRPLRSESEIMSSWNGDPSQPLVSICCITYNHEPYIEDALEGFLIQETDFPFEILIHDDASTDRTADIIREYEAKYPALLKPVYQTVNQFSQGKNPNIEFNFPRANGKYIAFCEGDDYWINPKKLQIQVEFLEENCEYGLVHTDNSHYFQNTGAVNFSHKKNYYPTPPNGNVFNQLLIKNFISTLTVVARKKLLSIVYSRLYEWIKKDLIIDYTIWLEFSKFSKIMYLDNVTAMYRISDGTMSRPKNDYEQSLFLKKRYDIVNSFIDQYEIERKTVDEFYMDFFEVYLNKIHKWKNFYFFDKTVIKKYKPSGLKGHLLKLAYLYGCYKSTFWVVQLIYFIYRKPYKLFLNRRKFNLNKIPFI